MFDILKYFNLEKKLNDDLITLAKVLAVAAFLDKRIKKIEMLQSQLIIKEYIKKRKISLSPRNIKISTKRVYNKYLDILKSYKNDEEKLKIDKESIKKHLTVKQDKELLFIVELIIKADNVIDEREKTFLEEIKEITMDSNKRAFTLMEIVFVILSIGLLSYYTLSGTRQNNFYAGINNLNNDIANILDNAVMNSTTGYVNATGGDCSNDNSYVNLTSKRAIDCIGWSSAYPHSGLGTSSYVYKLLKNYTTNGNGCKLYLKEKSSEEYYVYLDCSNINFAPATRSKKYTEDKVEYGINNHFSTIIEATYRNATSIDNTSGGNDHDGKISFLMKK